MRVIGAGFGRTGTRSLKGALEELGFGPCYHMTELFGHPEHVELWDAATRGEPVDWEGLFRDYEATVDWPGCSFYEELMRAYPDAKVLLSVRDPDRWYESAYNTIYRMSRTSHLFYLIRLFSPRVGRAYPVINRLIWEGTFDGRFEDRGYTIEVFEGWNEEVKERVPAERLLVYEVKEGWGPLCDFLGVAVPEGKPFPHLNDIEAFRRMIRSLSVLAVGAPVVAIFLAVISLRRLRRRR
jgi:hypothetical protein